MTGFLSGATAFAYLTGILSAAKLGSRVASFIGLLEVLFAILFAWWLLGEVPTLLQVLGGAFIVAGIVLVKMERTSTRRNKQGRPYGTASSDNVR